MNDDFLQGCKFVIQVGLLLGILFCRIPPASAQSCQTGSGMDAPTRTALENTGKRYFDMAAKGDTASLQQNSIASLAASFGGIESAVKENQSAFSGAQATARPPFLLEVEGNAPSPRIEFLCGVFGPKGQTSNSSVFVLNNLSPGKYGLVILDVRGSKDPRTLTVILQQVGTDWKLAGFLARSAQVGGHDGAWFLQKARDFKAKGKQHNAWLYYREAITLSTPVDFMSTLATDNLYDEAQSVQPSDVPAGGNTVDLAASKTYKLTEIFPLAVGNDLDVVVKYQAADVSNSGQTFQENTAVMKALLTKFPELREAFAGIVARAVEPSGRDYGSMLPMDKIK